MKKFIKIIKWSKQIKKYNTIREKEITEKKKLFDELIENETENKIKVIIEKGKFLEENKMYLEAYETYEKINELNDTQKEGYILKIRLLEKIEKYDEALMTIELGLTTIPNSIELLILKGITYYN
jgi:tetratricopeptide (TPR) repeat protein